MRDEKLTNHLRRHKNGKRYVGLTRKALQVNGIGVRRGSNNLEALGRAPGTRGAADPMRGRHKMSAADLDASLILIGSEFAG